MTARQPYGRIRAQPQSFPERQTPCNDLTAEPALREDVQIEMMRGAVAAPIVELHGRAPLQILGRG